jgi:hypothetical protein
MSAFTDLLQFATELTPVQSKRFLDLLSAHITEEQRQVNLLLADTSADSKPFEVVAIAGTADTLLNEINVGDTVELNPNVEQTLRDIKYLQKDKKYIKCINTVTAKYNPSYGTFVEINQSMFAHRIELFRKVQTPLSNPHQTIEGC